MNANNSGTSNTGSQSNPNTQTQAMLPPGIDANMIAAILAALQASGVSAQTQSTTTKAAKIKIKEPDTYDGKNRGGDTKRFILSCENDFQARSNNFPDDEAQIQFALSYLGGTTQAWGDVILQDLLGAQISPATTNWSNFKTEFIQAFGDPDKEGTAIQKLEALSQDNRPAATYAVDLRCIKADISWNEQAFMHAYRQGLRADVKNGLVYHDKPTMLEKLIELSIQIDDRLWEQKQEKGSDHSNKPQHRPSPRPTPTPAQPSSEAPNAFAHNRLVPIQIDAARRGRLMPEERARGINYPPNNYTNTIAATQTPTTNAPSPRPNNSFTVSIAPQSTNRSDSNDGGFLQGFPPAHSDCATLRSKVSDLSASRLLNCYKI
ncbi:hypothetical protein FRC04_011895 [Tulasnella sp. 424]|nr:hypothetical protein FRC04_011895 [Tulasnella sp. 424]